MALGTGMAGAQELIQSGNSWKLSDNNWTGSFNGCVSKGNGLVDCTFTETYVGAENMKTGYWSASDVIIVLNGGQEIKASELTVGGNRERGSQAKTMYQNMPVTAIAHFKLPTNVSVLPRVVYGRALFSNVTFRNTAAPAPRPASSPAPANTAAYNAVMTNCKPGAGGTLTCTATLTPRR